MQKRIRTGKFVYLGIVTVLLTSAPPLAAVDPAVRVDSNGNVGIGTVNPLQVLHLARAAGGAVGNNVGFRLQNLTTGSQWEFTGVEGAIDHFIINKLGSGKQEMRLNESGDMTIVGKIITGGPDCMAGCDAVFSPGFEIESVEEHAAAMWENSHLPAVGPTSKGQAVNISDKVGGLINELEKAHIYIERLNEDIKQARTEAEQHRREAEQKSARLLAIEARLARMEALLAARPDPAN